MKWKGLNHVLLVLRERRISYALNCSQQMKRLEIRKATT
uniref:Uncharacterized protein MANES_01G012900 n=1 Tax=Rhizophora mucronata TaxID=61149 RepID=A0A2P2M2I1_RHIMU